MSKEFCTYEQALALKELGFDEPCLGCFKFTYHPNGKIETYKLIQVGYGFNNKSGITSINLACPLYIKEFIDIIRSFAFDYYHNKKQGNFSDANDLMSELEDGRKPIAKTIEEAIKTLKSWGVKKNEFNSFLEDYVKDFEHMDDSNWAERKKELTTYFK